MAGRMAPKIEKKSKVVSRSNEKEIRQKRKKLEDELRDGEKGRNNKSKNKTCTSILICC